MKSVITINVDHHGATKALARILSMLDWLRDGYGVTSLTYTHKEVERFEVQS